MNILKINPDLWQEIDKPFSPIKYVGRCHYDLGLGNPFSHEQGRQVQFMTKTKQQAVNQYRDWINSIVTKWIAGHKQDEYKERYLKLIIQLASSINTGKITALATYDYHAIDYQLVEDGEEQSHAQILYRQCLRITEFLKQRT